MRPRGWLREYAEALLIAVVFALFARTFVVQAFRIPSGSMEKNLVIGDHILVNKFIYGPTLWDWEERWLPQRHVRQGDVVVFKFPEDPSRDFIKRCIAQPGDRLEIVDKAVFVNGEKLSEGAYVFFADPRVYQRSRSIFLDDSFRLRDNYGPYTVPDESLFCLGDNRDNSNDSRFWGPVPTDYVKGRAFLVYWSFEGAEEPAEAQDLQARLERFRSVLGHFFSRTRWDRSFQLVR